MRTRHKVDLLSEPLYTVTDLARWLRLSPTRVRHWLLGYTYSAPRGETRIDQPPIVRDRYFEDAADACFLDLVELRLIHDLLERGWSLTRVRKAHEDISSRLDTPYPFAQREFYVRGKNLYVAFQEKGKRHVMEAMAGGQYAIEPVVQAVSEELKFDNRTGRAMLWYPIPDGKVIVDPSRAFGAPTVVGHNVKTANIYSMYEAEDHDAERVAKWFQIGRQEVSDAVRFEESLKAA